jgi:hypothetical protein
MKFKRHARCQESQPGDLGGYISLIITHNKDANYLNKFKLKIFSQQIFTRVSLTARPYTIDNLL